MDIVIVDTKSYMCSDIAVAGSITPVIMVVGQGIGIWDFMIYE